MYLPISFFKNKNKTVQTFGQFCSKKSLSRDFGTATINIP